MTDVDKIIKFGQDYNWPSMILKRIDGKVIKTLGKGKQFWDNAIALNSLKDPYKDNFRDLVRAVDEYDVWRQNINE